FCNAEFERDHPLAAEGGYVRLDDVQNFSQRDLDKRLQATDVANGRRFTDEEEIIISQIAGDRHAKRWFQQGGDERLRHGHRALCQGSFDWFDQRPLLMLLQEAAVSAIVILENLKIYNSFFC
ncbi:hypothetical protein Tsp_12923, partial [Trichinella spiralis]|uniref:hypothetical protein n=1 Tax=Trichinella spiralis TaxID=6334 RepID=UPI0001EFD617